VKELKKLELPVRQRKSVKRHGRYKRRFISAVAIFLDPELDFHHIFSSLFSDILPLHHILYSMNRANWKIMH
jgi:hypothetical protein